MRALAARIARAIDRLNVAGAWVAALACAALAAMLLVEVLVTSRLAWSQPWAVEYASYLTAVALFAGAGYSLRHAAHIRVEVAQSVLRPALARAVDLVCTLAALVIATILAYGLAELAIRSFERNSRSYFVMQTPLAVPQALLAASVALLVLALVARALRLSIGEAPEVEASE